MRQTSPGGETEANEDGNDEVHSSSSLLCQLRPFGLFERFPALVVAGRGAQRLPEVAAARHEVVSDRRRTGDDNPQDEDGDDEYDEELPTLLLRVHIHCSFRCCECYFFQGCPILQTR